MEKKYKLTEESINFNGIILYRIESIKDFGNISKGQKGGFVESERNLSQYDNAWVYGDAKVSGNACVCDNAWVYGYAEVCDNAWIHGNAWVYGYAKVSGNAKVSGDAKVCDNAKVSGYAKVCDNTWVCGNAEVYENACVFGNAWVCDNAWVFGNADVYGNAKMRGDAKVCDNEDYIVFKNWWSSGRYFTWTRSNNMWNVGCFLGTGKELIKKAYKDSEKSGIEYERVVKYVENILADEKK